VVFYIKGW